MYSSDKDDLEVGVGDKSGPLDGLKMLDRRGGHSMNWVDPIPQL